MNDKEKTRESLPIVRNYNEYIELTKIYLKSYNIFKAKLVNLENIKNKYKKRLDGYLDVAAGIANYDGGTPVGGGNAFSSSVVDRTAEKREKIQKKLKKIVEDIELLKIIIYRIDSAYMMLSDKEKEIIRQHYYNRENWQAVADRAIYSRRWGIRKGTDAIKKMALMIFGEKTGFLDIQKFINLSSQV